MPNSLGFQVIYEGPSLETNEMDVRELAPALISIADLLEEANHILNGDAGKVQVNVHGSFKSGSFGIDFGIVYSIYQTLISYLTSDGATAAANLLSIVGLKDVGEGLIGLIRKIRGRKIEKVENVDNNRVRIYIKDERTIEIDKPILDLYKSHRARKALEEIITRPLSRDGVDTFATVFDARKASIKKDEKDYFVAPPLENEVLSDTVIQAHVQIVSLTFREDNKWRLTRGGGEGIFYALITDKEFLEQVDRNEIKFSKNDILKVKLRIKEILTDSGLKTEYEVSDVIEHRSAARQLRLPMENKDGV